MSARCFVFLELKALNIFVKMVYKMDGPWLISLNYHVFETWIWCPTCGHNPPYASGEKELQRHNNWSSASLSVPSKWQWWVFFPQTSVHYILNWNFYAVVLMWHLLKKTFQRWFWFAVLYLQDTSGEKQSQKRICRSAKWLSLIILRVIWSFMIMLVLWLKAPVKWNQTRK